MFARFLCTLSLPRPPSAAFAFAALCSSPAPAARSCCQPFARSAPLALCPAAAVCSDPNSPFLLRSAPPCFCLQPSHQTLEIVDKPILPRDEINRAQLPSAPKTRSRVALVCSLTSSEPFCQRFTRIQTLTRAARVPLFASPASPRRHACFCSTRVCVWSGLPGSCPAPARLPPACLNTSHYLLAPSLCANA